MKYMLLIHQGDDSDPERPEAWGKLSEDEQKQVYAAYGEINKTPGVTAGHAAAAARDGDHRAGRRTARR